MIFNPTIIKKGGGTELPAFMSAKNFTFNGNACTGYVGDNSLPEIIIPKSYSTITSTETVAGAKVLDKENLSMSIYDFQSATFSDGGTNTQTYTSTSQLQNLSTDFPNDCYLVSMEVLDVFNFDFLIAAYDMQMLQFPIAVNGQSFSDGMAAFEYIQINNITNVNFGGDVEVTKFVDGNDYQVTSVSGSSNGSGFTNYQNRIILLSNLTSIGISAFSSCTNLTSIEIPSGVTSIGDNAFDGCSSLTSIEIPSSVTSIGSYAFYGCSSLTSIEIPSGVTSIGDNAFDGCSSLTSIEIPSGVTSIGDNAFYGCSSLTSIEIPSGVTSIGVGAFSSCSSLTSIEIPSSVTSIGSYAFRDCSSLTSIKIPSGVTSIGSLAFSGCSGLTSIEIPNSVTSIGVAAFRDCSSLTSIEIPSSVTSIGKNAFRDCSSLTSIEIPESVTSIGESAFYGCTNIIKTEGELQYLKATVDGVLNEYFAVLDTTSTSISTANINANCKIIAGSAFEHCNNLTNITIPNSVTSIGNSAFQNCSSLTSIEIPSSVTSIGNYAFRDCSSLTNITIPEGVTSIGFQAFAGCSGLTSIEIPSSVTSIGGKAFGGCTSLVTVQVNATTPPTIQTNTFDDTVQRYEVPAESVEAYKTATNWANYADKIFAIE